MRTTLLVVVLALPAAAGAAGTPLLVAVVPDLPGSSDGDEGFALGCNVACDLTGLVVTDGETSWPIPPGAHLDAGASLWFVGNRTVWDLHNGPGPAVEATGLPRLANAGDDLSILAVDGTIVDAMEFGDGTDFDVPASAGLILQRLPSAAGDAWRDTDSMDDWRTPRLHRIGESDIPMPTFDVDRLTLYASPDSSFEVLTGLIASAHERLHLHVYELRSAALADALIAAKQATPTLDLQVLVDANPVGADAEDRHATADALRRIEAVGGVAVLAGNGRYDDHHLKVLVADDAVAVQSENWVPSGVPQDPSWGNRGWGVIAHDEPMADWFAAWMKADRDSWEVEPFELATYDPTFQAPFRQAPRSGAHKVFVPSLDVAGPIRVTPVVAPDHTQDPLADPITAVAAHATGRLDIEQLDLSTGGSNKLGWSGGDPLADALVTAKQRGATVRVLASAPFSADDTDNADALEWLAERGVAGATFDRDGMVLHNKGLVADGTLVVGSLNGNLHSRAQNREVDLIIESPEAARYFGDLFDGDWSAGPAPRDWSVPAQDLKGLPFAPWPILLAVLGVVASRGRRWS
jgi:cardiolipin synthase A/B